ncbi:molecular chaperone TorD family protein [Shewanella sp. ULN5]|uniref:TorD/DmsD family molecular chaperone n=1 Tax=Shewanella sp. ULN5 TaxID=2994678 RepID=UPI00273D16E1|nr:molecular chaperone TorD family protein [Shewanella sp. ULN5]MDP5148336.1 molecular chaperone TorD family protein [Shewanella sp. ULN5]
MSMNEHNLTEQFTISSAVFNLLSTTFYSSVDDVVLKTIEECFEKFPYINEKISQSVNAVLEELKKPSLERIIIDFNELFIGAPFRKVYPWGSYYTDPEKLLFGESTLSYRNFLNVNGISVNFKGNEPTDHFALIFSVLAAVMGSEKSTDDKILMVDTIMYEHLEPWISGLLESICVNAKTVFYQHQALIALEMITLWRTLLKTEDAILELNVL